MKKIILLSLITIGIGTMGATAQAGGISVRIGLPLLPPLPPLPIFAPPAVVVGGGYRPGPVVVGNCAPDYRYHVDVRRDGRFHDRRFDDRHFDVRRDARFHDRR